MKGAVGLVGLAVMGENLALNIERNGYPIAVFNRSTNRTAAFLDGRARGRRVIGAATLDEFVASLESPRRIILMVKAGAPVDAVLDDLLPRLAPGDIVVDGGNSHFADTERRMERVATAGICFVGMGVSGGEEGALWGPSLMPGGEEPAYRALEPILTRIAAQVTSGPCVTYVGRGGAGHFVKMVHNGIEYGDMQLIAEAYDLLREGLGLPSAEIAAIFEEWNAGELSSYLIEITARIVDFPDDRGDGRLVDAIRDVARQKGTGKWTTTAALDLGVPVPTITAAVDARILSAEKDLRARAARSYGGTSLRIGVEKGPFVAALRSALYASKICSYAQGFALLRRASDASRYGVRLSEIARIWKGGCIIRAAFLDKIRGAFDRDPALENLLLDAEFRSAITARLADWRRVVAEASAAGLAPAAMSASLAYFDAFRRERLPANLIQAQRDYFGAHTYERIDREGTFHTRWTSAGDDAAG